MLLNAITQVIIHLLPSWIMVMAALLHGLRLAHFLLWLVHTVKRGDSPQTQLLLLHFHSRCLMMLRLWGQLVVLHSRCCCELLHCGGGRRAQRIQVVWVVLRYLPWCHWLHLNLLLLLLLLKHSLLISRRCLAALEEASWAWASGMRYTRHWRVTSPTTDVLLASWRGIQDMSRNATK